MWWYFIFEPRGWLLTSLALAIIITVILEVTSRNNNNQH